MRKIEKEMLRAFNEKKNWSLNNTRIEVFNGEISVYLHGNAIYRIVDGVRYFTLDGWNTQTTKSRLRALGVNVVSKKGNVYYNGKEINIYCWHVI